MVTAYLQPCYICLMQTDSQFVDNYVAAVQDERPADEHDAWLNLRLATDFMRSASAAMRAGCLVIALHVVLLYGHVNSTGLLIWAVLSFAMMGYRYLSIREFDKLLLLDLRDQQGVDVNAFFKRRGWSWPASAVLFAASILLHFQQAPAPNQYLCLMMLVGLGVVGASLMAAHLDSQRKFTHGLCGTGLLAIIAISLMSLPAAPPITTLVFCLLVIVFWVTVLYLGKHLHALQRSSYSAQFGNEQLIRSLRQQTQAATSAVQTKNNLLASATHDLRQPVHALAFYADWLRNEPHLADSLIPKILAATDSVNTLFNSLFDFARIESGALKVHWDLVDIEELMNEITVQFAPAAHKKGLSLTTVPVAVTVRSDPVLLRRIVANLLANAIRYTEKGGVMAEARLVDQKLWIEVSDSGQGIAPEYLPHVFKEFYRAPGHEGTADSFGLGLAIVQKLSRSLGHTVTLRSVLGKGTRCRLEIDLSHSPREAGRSTPMPLDSSWKSDL
jgi:signal transduction histidine kinase